MLSSFTQQVIILLRSVPPGRVVSYGALARAAGSPRGARQVVRILHTQSERHRLPWHRVVTAAGTIAFQDQEKNSRQKELLAAEGVEVDSRGSLDRERYFWEF